MDEDRGHQTIRFSAHEKGRSEKTAPAFVAEIVS
jgi:hypothetical protein